MTAFFYIFKVLTDILSPLGLLVLIIVGSMGALSLELFIVGGIAGVVGIVFGVFAFIKGDIPPRWFWAKSKFSILNKIIGGAFGYGVNFAFTAIGIMGAFEIYPYIIDYF